MTTEYITFVSVSTVLGALRWIAAILFVLFVIFMLIRQVKTKKSFAFIASFISALAIVPFLVLTPVTLTIEQGTTPEPTPVNPIPNKDPEPEPQPEPEPIIPIEPVKPSGDTPNYQPPVAPEQPATPTEPEEPEEPKEPEATATYKVIHRQQNLDNDEYSAIESETKTGIVGKTVTPETKTYTGFVAPTTKTVTLAESGTEVIYDYKRAMIAFSVEDDEYVISSLPENSYKYGTEVTLTAKDRDGYTFDHWNDESSSTENPTTIAIESATPVKPIYAPNNYRIVFYKNDDAATGSMAAQTLTYDESTPLNANTFALAGYSFDHWGDNDADTGARYTNQQSVKNLATEGDFALYAFWTANNDTPYTVNHYKMKVGGTGYELAESEPKTGTTDTIATPDRKSYAGFTAPAAESKKITGDGEMHIDYYYSRNQYTITFTENAANITSDTFTSGEKYYYEQSGNLTAGSKTGYTFENWTDGATDTTRSFTMGTANAEIGAEYRANTYTVIFHANYQGNSATTTQSFTYDQALTALSTNGFNRAGYDFAHWNTKANDSGDNYDNRAEVQNLTAVDGGEFHLYAQWTPRDDTHYIVHHQLMNINGQGYGRGVDEDGYGTSDTEVTPAVKSFNGFTAPQPKTITIAADGSTEVYYNYDRQKRTLTIEDAEFVETTTPSDEYYFNTYITLKAKDREGYTFVRWSNREDNTNQTYSFNLSDNTTIRPIYAANTYNVVFHSNVPGNDQTSTQSFTYDDAYKALAANEFTYTGHEFNKWATNADGTGDTYDDEETVRNLTTSGDFPLYAKWTESAQPVYVCRKATTLHEAPNGYFGQLPDDNNPKQPGDAYDCQVSDTVTQRFYYIGKNGNNAVLLSSEGIDYSNNYSYDNAYNLLYTSATWNNDKLVEFDDGKVTRFITYQEVLNACPNAKNDNALLDCSYFLEGTAYDPITTGRSAYWIKIEGTQLWRIHNNGKKLVTAQSSNTSVSRPVIEVPTAYIEGLAELPKYTITFNSKGGSAVADKIVEAGDPIGTLETPEYLGYTFEGWYTNEQYDQAVTASFIATDNMELLAKWAQTNVAAITNGVTYETLQLAINAVPTSGEQTEVTLLKNVSEKLDVEDGRYVYLTIGNNTISNSGSNNVFNVNENSTLEIHDGKIESNTSQGVINVNKKGKLVVTGGKISATGSKQAIYTKGGNTTISGNPIITATSGDRAAVQVLNDGSTVGTTTILGGTIISTNFNAVYGESGTLVIGAENGQADNNEPIMIGKKFGIASAVSYSFYGGKAMGETFSIGSSATASDTTHSRISNIESGLSLIDGEETIDSATYKTLYLSTTAPTQSNITFNANGGTIIGQSSKIVAANDPLSILPDATYAKHSFLGWFDGNGDEIDESTVPTGDAEYIAHWQELASSDIDYYNIQSSAVTRYMNNINSWKAPEETLLTELRDNFNFYNCKISASEDISGSFPTTYRYITTGTNLCDQPRGYDTGANGAIAVYQSSESQKEKGAHIAYLDSSNGIIVNMIPNQTYYWESTSNPDEHGYVKAIGERRQIALPNTRNARDIGGLAAADGKTIKYGIILRGEELASAADVAALRDLGTTQEYDVRTSGKNGSHFPTGHYRTNVGMHNYDIMYSNKPDYYAEARNALTQLMTDIAAGESVYIHCSHGVDRAGTLVYLAEMLLGVSVDDIDIDYELSSFSGRADRTRYYRHKDGNSSEFNPDRKYEYLKQNLGSYQEVYNWFIDQSADPVADAQLIEDFRTAALE